MKFTDVGIIFVTLFAPLFAIQAQKWLERRRDWNNRKESVFRTLMASRAARVSPEHVQALNMIDLEFYAGGEKERKVREAWNEYRDHLDTPHTQETYPIWETKGTELFIELLYEMSICVNRKFEKPHIRKSVYSPVAHGNLEQDHNIIRSGLVALFSKKFAIPIMTIPASKEEAESQASLQKLLAESLTGQRPYKVEIVTPNGADLIKRTQAGGENGG